MTHLRQIMLEELERRNYAPGTITCYIRSVENFARHFHRPPDQLGPEHIREYQSAMFRKWKLAPNTVAQRLAALRFFYMQVLKQSWSVAETPYPKKVLHLPQVLSQEEVARLIDAAQILLASVTLPARPQPSSAASQPAPPPLVGSLAVHPGWPAAKNSSETTFGVMSQCASGCLKFLEIS